MKKGANNKVAPAVPSHSIDSSDPTTSTRATKRRTTMSESPTELVSAPPRADESSSDTDSSSESSVPVVYQNRPPIVKGNTFRAVFRKNVNFQKRQKKTLCFQACCPVFVMLIIIAMDILIKELIPVVEWERVIEIPNLYQFKYNFGLGARTFLMNDSSTNVGMMRGPSNLPGDGYGLLGLMPQTPTYEGIGLIYEPHIEGPLFTEAIDMNAAWIEARNEFYELNRKVRPSDEERGEIFGQYFLCTGMAYLLDELFNTSDVYYPPGTPCTEVFPAEFLNGILNQIPSSLLGGGGSSASAERPEFVDLTEDEASLLAGFVDFPAGGIEMQEVTSSSLSYTLNVGSLLDMFDSNFIQITQLMFFQYKESCARFNFYAQNIHNAFARLNISPMSSIQAGFREMPRYTTDPNFDFDIPSFVARDLFPFITAILIPLYVQLVVVEKELRLKEMMKMMGLDIRLYWVVNYIFHYLLHTISSIFFIVSGLIIGLDWFHKTPAYFYIVFLFLWGHTSIAFGYFIAAFFGKTLKAMVFSYLLMIASIITSNIMNAVLFCGDAAPIWWILYPPFVCFRMIYIISTAAGTKTYLTGADFAPNSEFAVLCGFLVWQAIFFMVLSFYVEAVFPKKYGIRRPWNYPYLDLMSAIQKNIPIDEVILASIKEKQANEDSDVAAERALVNTYTPERIAQGDLPAVLIHNLHKQYSMGAGRPKNIALSDPAWKIDYGECFGLLGPNGAGKSTLISILTGLYPPTAGDAYICGYSIRDNMSEIHHLMGVCPQHDTIWTDLTIRETLLFYARLKGVPASEEAKHVQDRIDEMQLGNRADYLTKELSGGMLRRLSIGIALTGNSRIIFLDEPTTGLDPETKHEIWKVIQDAKKNRCILLTTHSMEEADVLCSRIGILSQGSLACLGNQQLLKSKFGSGFKVKISAEAGRLDEAKKFVLGILPTATVVTSFQNTVTYEVAKADMRLGPLFRTFDTSSKQAGIVDWGVSQTSLEEVFFALVSADEAAGR